MTEIPWYQQQHWQLIGAIAVLIFTNGIAILGIYIRARASHLDQLRIKKLEHASQQLSEFYDPLYTLLLTNSRVFSECGPPSFGDDPISRNASGEVWNRLKLKVILPNNVKVLELLTGSAHLICKDDSLTFYIPLKLHCSMYEIFLEEPTEVYKKFQFPKGILRRVEQHRQKIIEEIEFLREGAK